MASCGSLDQSNPSNSTAFFTPRVTGMWIIDEINISKRTWGKPKSNLAPYPNPTTALLFIPFEVRSDTAVVFIWAVKALDPFEVDNSFSYGGGANVYAPKAASTISIFNGSLPKGNHLIFADLVVLPSGFYTVYLSLEGRIQLADILIAQEPEDIPLYLRDILGYP